MKSLNRALTSLGAAAALGALVTSAGLAATSLEKTRDGQYTTNDRLPSAAVFMKVAGSGTRMTSLLVQCNTTNPTLRGGSLFTFITLHGPDLPIRGGRVGYDGTAKVVPGSVDDPSGPTTGTVPFSIHLHRVTGPTVHYVVDGRRVTVTALWKGTVTSSACSIADHGKVTLIHL